MPQTVARTRFGPETFEVNVAVTGGMLVEPDGVTQKVKPATLNSVTWLGVALYDAQPAGTTGEDTVYGFPRIDLGVPRSDLAVAWHGTFKLKATGALNFGDVVYAGANGEVQKTTVTGRVVGQVVQKEGIAAGAFGLVRLF